MVGRPKWLTEQLARLYAIDVALDGADEGTARDLLMEKASVVSAIREAGIPLSALRKRGE